MLAQGRENAKQALRDRPDTASQIEQTVRAKLTGADEVPPSSDGESEEM